jgi:hypothetical protein
LLGFQCWFEALEQPIRTYPLGFLQLLTADEMGTVRKIYDEAKSLLEQRYSSSIDCPQDWHLYKMHGADTKKPLSYKLP